MIGFGGRGLAAALFAVGCACTASAAEAPAVVRFASVEWPPFSSVALPQQGLASAVISSVLQRSGQVARFDYFPWKRAVMAGSVDPAYAGYLPTWRTPERDRQCYFSAPVANTRTVFAFLKDAPLQIRQLADLKNVPVGVVAGFSNGDEFDTMVTRGQLMLEEGLSDELNLRKLLAGRMRVVVIEKHVLNYLLASPHFSAGERARVTMADQLIGDRPVHICFQRSAAGLALRDRFDAAARQVDVGRIERDYLRRLSLPAS